MQNLYRLLLTLILSLSVFSISAHDLKGAISSEDRTPANKLRDSERNPYETLSFFGIESDMVVVELSPGGGWYTEILANYIHYPGTLIAAHFSADSERAYFKRSRANFEKKIEEKRETQRTRQSWRARLDETYNARHLCSVLLFLFFVNNP